MPLTDQQRIVIDTCFYVEDERHCNAGWPWKAWMRYGCSESNIEGQHSWSVVGETKRDAINKVWQRAMLTLPGLWEREYEYFLARKEKDGDKYVMDGPRPLHAGVDRDLEAAAEAYPASTEPPTPTATMPPGYRMAREEN